MLKNEIEKSEELFENLLDFQKDMIQERENRYQSEILLEGLNTLTKSENEKDVFSNLLLITKKLTKCENSFIFKLGSGGILNCIYSSTTDEKNEEISYWNILSRVELGKPLIIFDSKLLSDDDAVPFCIKENTQAILVLQLRPWPQQSWLICTHSQKGFFSYNAVKRADRFTRFAQQALKNLDHIIEFKALNRQLKKEVDERKKVEIKLEESHIQIIQSSKMAALGEMASGIAHEINNPLTAISGSAFKINLILEKSQVSEYDLKEIKEVATKIESTVKRVSVIIKGLKDFSRDGQHDPLVKISLKETILETLALCKEKLRETNIMLKFNTEIEAEILGNATEISQVILNLINNSIDAIIKSDNPFIDINLTEINEFYRISIIDSGKGIPKEIRDKIMQPFFTTKGVGKGTGLGLSISKGLIEKQGGSFFIDTECPNTKFVIELIKNIK